jgi:hypothetical protein
VAVADTAANGCPFASRNEIVTDGLPLAVGLNCTLNGKVCPAAKLVGSVTPVTWNPELNPWMELTLTAAEVLFETESDIVFVLPTITVPKFSVALATPIVPLLVALL